MCLFPLTPRHEDNHFYSLHCRCLGNEISSQTHKPSLQTLWSSIHLLLPIPVRHGVSYKPRGAKRNSDILYASSLVK